MKIVNSMIDGHRLNALHEMLKQVTVEGSIMEVGVFMGGSAVYLVDSFPDRKIFLVDTFDGIPYIEKRDGPHHPIGTFKTDINAVIALFSDNPNVKILQGIFPDAFKDKFNEEEFAVVHLDVDQYKSYKDGLEFVYPRIVPGGIIIFDDYSCPATPGATIAINEFLATVPENIIETNAIYYITKRGIE
jgi:O-methyltransferase